MIVCKSIADWQQYRQALAGDSLGLVPTMGALHAGHESLVRKSVEENTATTVTLFVNPTQFDSADDLENYPGDQERDLILLRNLHVDAVFMPEFSELYPDQFRYRVIETELSHRLCGTHRRDHFDGVLTVVLKLLNLARADNAYFGLKDYQQLQLIRGMAEAFFISTRIVACPIVREPDGLALSSRNQRLSADQRAQAAALYRTLEHSGSAAEARTTLQQLGFEVDYVEDFDGHRLAAASLGGIRLIDNVPIP